MNIAIIVQARMSSSRFPGKMLASVQGVPLAVWVCRRAWARAHHHRRRPLGHRTGLHSPRGRRLRCRPSRPRRPCRLHRCGPAVPVGLPGRAAARHPCA